MKIYVATSWKNILQPAVVAALRSLSQEVYDFRHPVKGDDGFSWSEIDPNWTNWTNEQYLEALEHSAAKRGFKFDMDALEACDMCILVLPCGRSAHLELGYAQGANKRTMILLQQDNRDVEAELMYKMVDRIVTTFDDMLKYIEELTTVTA